MRRPCTPPTLSGMMYQFGGNVESFKAFSDKLTSIVDAHGPAGTNNLTLEQLKFALDAVFNEDQSRVRKDYAPQNMAIIRHIVLNMLNNAKKHFKKDMSIKGLRKKAGWGNTTLHLILQQSF